METDVLVGRVGAGLAAAGLEAAARDDVVARTGRWLRTGDAAAAAAVTALVEAEDWPLLADAFGADLVIRGGRLRGTAGPGPNRVNERTVAAAARAHADAIGLVPGASGDEEPRPEVVLAWDHRRPETVDATSGEASSRDLARAAAEAYIALGFAVAWPSEESGRALAEPELAAFVRRRGAVGGLYVGADAAPPPDRGCQFFGADGTPCEIGGFASADVASHTPWAEAEAAGRVHVFSDYERDRWHAAVGALSRRPDARDLHVVFSPLNGVAGPAVGGALARAGFRVTAVREQAVQDEGFGAVPFRRPDPTRRDALDAAVAVAREIGADLVIATDATGTRIGAAVPDEALGFRTLGEDDIAALVAGHVFGDAAGDGLLLASVDSSPLVVRIAAAAGARVIADLAPGFAAVGAALGDALPASGAPFLAVADGGALSARWDLPTADAAAAAFLLAERVAADKAAGCTPSDALRAIWLRHGYVGTRRRTLRFEGPGRPYRGDAVRASLAEHPPRRLAGRKVTSVQAHGDAVVWTLEQGARAAILPGQAGDAVSLVVTVSASPLPADADALLLMRALGETEGQVGGLLEDLVREALNREGVLLPRAALAVPDFVGVDLVEHVFRAFVPELEVRVQEILARHVTEAEVRAWVAEALEAYGPDARALLRPGVEAHLAGLRGMVGERARPALDLIRRLFEGADRRSGDGAATSSGRPSGS